MGLLVLLVASTDRGLCCLQGLEETILPCRCLQSTLDPVMQTLQLYRDRQISHIWWLRPTKQWSLYS